MKKGHFIPMKKGQKRMMLTPGKVMPVGGNPVFFTIYPVPNYSNLFLCSIYALCSQVYDGIIKDNATGRNIVFFDNFLLCGLPYPADKVDTLFMPVVKVFMTLIVPICNSRLSFCYNSFHKGTFIRLSMSKEYLARD